MDDGGVVPNEDVFDGDCRDLAWSLAGFPGARTEAALTSAIIIRRNAFAMDASTPTRSNSIERCESLFTETVKFFRSNMVRSRSPESYFAELTSLNRARLHVWSSPG